VAERSIKSITDIAILYLLTEADSYVAKLCEKLPLNSQTLYSAMKKLETKKYVSSYWQEGNVGGRRHMYSITKSGRTYYEANKIDFDYALLSLAHKQKKEEAQSERKVYIPVDMSENDRDTENKAVNLPLSKNKSAVKAESEEIRQEIRQAIIPEEAKQEIQQEIKQELKTETKTETRKNSIAPYISPKDPIISTKKQPQQIEITISGTITADMQPLLKPNSVKTPCGFLLFNRLRLFAAIITACIIGIVYLIMFLAQKNTTLYAIAFEVLAGYLAIITAVWLVLPQNKKELSLGKFIGIRFLLTTVAVVIIWAVYLLVNSEQILWGIVPTIFCLIPIIEGGTILIFQKSKWFFC
jgi:DNA-binding PadR family transcriptional regulator